MATWRGREEPEYPALSKAEMWRASWRGLVVVLLFLVTFAIYLIGLLLEKLLPRLGLSTAMIWVFCAVSVRIIGMRVIVEGTPMAHGGARVANHSSWLDILSFRTAAQIYFVSKAEVASWPVVGFIARATGTMFIARKRTDAKRQEAQFQARLTGGDRLCFFPEGTSTDGLRVLPFKSSLFAAFLQPDLQATMWIQPMTAIYRAPPGQPEEFYAWWGESVFGEHVLQVLGKSKGGSVTVVFHPPVRVSDFADRKSLAAHCDQAVRAPLEAVFGQR